jgi:putative ABC transport system permease protein
MARSSPLHVRVNLLPTRLAGAQFRELCRWTGLLVCRATERNVVRLSRRRRALREGDRRVTWEMVVRQLTFRWRQQLLAVVGAATVFATALLATGMSAGFGAEVRGVVRGMGGDGWVLSAASGGPFSGVVPLDQSVAGQLGALPGVRRADPILILNESLAHAGKLTDVVVMGHPVGRAESSVDKGRSEAASGEAVADRSAGIALGSTVVLAGHPLHIVGRTKGRTILGGTPLIFVPLADAQAAGTGGTALISAVVVSGRPGALPAGLRFFDTPALTKGLLRPLGSARQAIAASRLLLWAVAVVIVACVTYMAAIEQVRDFAVLKAIGARSRTLTTGLAGQAVVVSLLAAFIALGLARVLRPGLGTFPVVLTPTSQVLLPVVAVIVGGLASLAGIRRALRTDPALAFAGAG